MTQFVYAGNGLFRERLPNGAFGEPVNGLAWKPLACRRVKPPASVPGRCGCGRVEWQGNATPVAITSTNIVVVEGPSVTFTKPRGER